MKNVWAIYPLENLINTGMASFSSRGGQTTVLSQSAKPQCLTQELSPLTSVGQNTLHKVMLFLCCNQRQLSCMRST